MPGKINTCCFVSFSIHTRSHGQVILHVGHKFFTWRPCHQTWGCLLDTTSGLPQKIDAEMKSGTLGVYQGLHLSENGGVTPGSAEPVALYGRDKQGLNMGQLMRSRKSLRFLQHSWLQKMASILHTLCSFSPEMVPHWS